MVNDTHRIDLSHNSNKSDWYITIKGDFYTEFTFKNRENAKAMYTILENCDSIFMDSLLIAHNKILDEMNGGK
jgi:hypothetical protein